MKDNGSPRAAEIAKGLSKSQREYLLGGYNPLGRWARTQGRFKQGMVTQRQLQRKGLLGSFDQTPLGEQVRAILSEPSS